MVVVVVVVVFVVVVVVVVFVAFLLFGCASSTIQFTSIYRRTSNNLHFQMSVTFGIS